VLTDPLKDFPGYALRRASARSMSSLADRLAALELRPAEASVLMVIGANPGVTQSEVGRMLDIAGANMAPLVSGLYGRSLLQKEQIDGRSHALTLSETGRALWNRVQKAFAAHEEALFEKLPKNLRAPFVEALRLLWQED
jgi:DNA-binding MarR family transcriptional regulator